MKTKIRFITTIISLVATLLVLIIALPISIYAARTATISGSGNLIYENELSVNDQKTLLANCGFSVTGSTNLQDMGDMESSSIIFNNPAQCRTMAMNNNVLRFELYQKVNCKNTTERIYELQVVLDFSQFSSIKKYSGGFMGFYNNIVFANDIVDGQEVPFSYLLPCYDFYSGQTIGNGNYSLKFSTTKSSTQNTIEGYTLELKDDNGTSQMVELCYKIILNYNSDSSVELGGDCFKVLQTSSKTDFTINNQIIPSTIYIDFSKSNIKLDEYNKPIGLTLPSSNDLSDNKHIHILGINDGQFAAALSIFEKYVMDNIKEKYEFSIYRKNTENSHNILCKLDGSSSDANKATILVIDDKYYGDSLVDEQRIALVRMCLWLYNSNITDAIVSHQKIDINMAFAGNPMQVGYRESTSASHPSNEWKEVYYASSDVIIGYFNFVESKIDVNVTTN